MANQTFKSSVALSNYIKQHRIYDSDIVDIIAHGDELTLITRDYEHNKHHINQ